MLVEVEGDARVRGRKTKTVNRQTLLITDLTAPSKASSTHNHLGVAAFGGGLIGSTSSTTFVDVAKATITFPAKTGGAPQVMMLGSLQGSESDGTATYDLRIGDSQTLGGIWTTYSALNNTILIVHGMFTMLTYGGALGDPAGTSLTYKLQAEVSAATNTLTINKASFGALLVESQGPLSGT